jgi:pullulanase
VKLWAPTATKVDIALFANATSEDFTAIAMSRDPNGVWSARIAGDQDGRYYLYEITHQNGAEKQIVYRVNDPYARGCSANSGRTRMALSLGP